MGDNDVREAWQDSGPYWERYAPLIRRFFEPLASELLGTVGIGPGIRLLDLAAGTGDLALAAAEGGARVVGADFSWPMISAAKRRAASAGYATIDSVQCDACYLPFGPESFDVVVSRLGIMFFPDTALAIREVVRVLRPGGRAAFAVWGRREENPFFGAISDVVSRYAPSEPEPPDAPGAWRFATIGTLAERISGAGVEHVDETLLDFVIAADLTFDEFWTVRVEMSDTLRDKVALLGADLAVQVKEETRAACAPYFTTGHACFPARCLIVSFTSVS